jgi:hypothetical protein
MAASTECAERTALAPYVARPLPALGFLHHVCSSGSKHRARTSMPTATLDEFEHTLGGGQ